MNPIKKQMLRDKKQKAVLDELAFKTSPFITACLTFIGTDDITDADFDKLIECLQLQKEVYAREESETK